MSQNKHQDLSCNETIRRAIQEIAWKNRLNSKGAIKDAVKVTGYVAKINTEGDLAGTVDVQEYTDLAIEEPEGVKFGYHEGVQLSALQDGTNGYFILPKLYSEVVISKDPDSQTEYISMYSHVDIIQLDSHEKVLVEVKEREKFDEKDEDAPDVHELEETGVYSRTTYIKDAIISEVHNSKDAHASATTLTGDKLTVGIDDDATTVEMDKSQIHMKRNNAETTVTSDKIVDKVGSRSVTVKSDAVYLGSETGTDNAVLGQELAGVLSSFLGYLGQMLIKTSIGPQPAMNLASFISLKAKVDAYKGGQTGFLTKHVMVQK